MKQFQTALAAVLFAAIASISVSLQANAASYLDYKSLKPSADSSSFLKAGYYERRADYDDEDEHEDDYENEDYEDDDYEEDYRPRKHYKRKYHKPRKRCYSEYVSKYVCDQTAPRCLKQRECIWHYGKEYCRYVRKCSHTEKTCNYVKVPKRRCW
jgi:hypothetical protein